MVNLKAWLGLKMSGKEKIAEMKERGEGQTPSELLSVYQFIHHG